jgi:hypothetical protein
LARFQTADGTDEKLKKEICVFLCESVFSRKIHVIRGKEEKSVKIRVIRGKKHEWHRD